jgi:hypothetical protein
VCGPTTTVVRLHDRKIADPRLDRFRAMKAIGTGAEIAGRGGGDPAGSGEEAAE